MNFYNKTTKVTITNTLVKTQIRGIKNFFYIQIVYTKGSTFIRGCKQHAAYLMILYLSSFVLCKDFGNLFKLVWLILGEVWGKIKIHSCFVLVSLACMHYWSTFYIQIIVVCQANVDPRFSLKNPLLSTSTQHAIRSGLIIQQKKKEGEGEKTTNLHIRIYSKKILPLAMSSHNLLLFWI